MADQNFRVKRGLEVGIGATVLVAQSSGNIGINSTAPEERLTVYHDGDAALFRNQDYSVSVYTTTPRIRFGTDTAYAGYMEIGAYASINNLDTKNRDFKLFSTAVNPILYAQEDTGNVGIGTDNPLEKLDVYGGSAYVRNIGGTSRIEVGAGQNSNQYAYIDFIGDTTYTDYGLRLLRGNDGENSWSELVHRGTGTFYLHAKDAGSISLRTQDTDRVRIDSSGNVGINSTAPTEKLDVVGTVKATDFNTTSDQNLKTNIQTIENPLDKIVQIRGVNFEWKENNKPSAGVIAQEVEKVLPQLVNGEDTKTVNYNGLIGLLIEAVKAQQEEINMLKERLK